jgi:hypothetical protein
MKHFRNIFLGLSCICLLAPGKFFCMDDQEHTTDDIATLMPAQIVPILLVIRSEAQQSNAQEQVRDAHARRSPHTPVWADAMDALPYIASPFRSLLVGQSEIGNDRSSENESPALVPSRSAGSRSRETSRMPSRGHDRPSMHRRIRSSSSYSSVTQSRLSGSINDGTSDSGTDYSESSETRSHETPNTSADCLHAFILERYVQRALAPSQLRASSLIEQPREVENLPEGSPSSHDLSPATPEQSHTSSHLSLRNHRLSRAYRETVQRIRHSSTGSL